MMDLRLLSVLSFFFFSQLSIAQNDTIQLKEVVVSTNRISLPHFKTSRTIQVITADEIAALPVTNVADALQLVAGLDIRRRGVEGMQSDLYIRGGNFDQTLVLIDGIKMDDPQTGHHTLNAMVSLENIERIEIIKGPAARVFGQNAFTGAVNIVTKKITQNSLQASGAYGSFENWKIGAGYAQKFKKGSTLISIQKHGSEGYRYNTDFRNTSFFSKSRFGNYGLLASYIKRDFGANGFYASPDYNDQYEETETSLVALTADYAIKSIQLTPRISWRRNQDMYLFLRQDSDYFRNFHISNKLSAEVNTVYTSSIGKTGFGIDLSRVYLASSNLGDHNRTMLTSFLEHRFELGRLDITPGMAFTHFSDFGSKLFPGLEMGYALSSIFKIYGNIGYTYRIPTYTDLYYNGPTTQGNPNLKPESAFSEELGIKYQGAHFQFTMALFNRDSENLIDWTKEDEEDRWMTQNFSKVATKGIETSLVYSFMLQQFPQQIQLNYTYIDDAIKDVNVAFTRYSLNSIKHQFNTTLSSKLIEFFNQSISYRYVERTDGESYHLVDAKVVANLKRMQLSFTANNIFNTAYTETNLVPMPKLNVMLGLQYNFF